MGTRPKILKRWKRKVTLACYIVAGCAFAVALVSACFLWRKPAAKRPEPWNTTAITAKYDEIRTAGEDNHIVFEYSLRTRDLSPCHDNVEDAIQFPIIVPARETALIVLEIPKQYPTPLTPASTSARQQDYHRALEGFAAAEMPNLRGFVLFDGEKHYEIDMPRGW